MKSFFRPGWRTMKTALSVFCCLFIYQLFAHGHSPAIACLSSVFALRETTSKAYSFGKSRIISNACGGFLALFIFQITKHFASQWLTLILLPLGVIVFIQLMNLLNNQAGIISGMAAFFMIYFTIPTAHSIHYALLRILDTFIGVIIAIIINHLVKPMKQQQLTTNEQIQAIEQKMQELEQQKSKLQQKNRND